MKPAAPLNILIVDDEEIVRQTLTAMMGHLGHKTKCVNDGVTGKEALKGKNYDAAFLDLRMPGLDGMSLLKWSRRQQLGVPIIIMTGHGTKDSQAEALQSGAFAFLYKPFSLMKIKQLVEKVQDAGIQPGVNRETGEELIRKALECGASLAGIASVEALAASRSYVGREQIKCAVKGKSLLVLALAQDKAWPEFDWWDSQPGGTPGNRRLGEIMDRVMTWLGEEENIESRALPYNVEKGGVFLKGAAILAGLGIIGKNNLLVTPAFGPRVRLRALLVDRELAQTGPVEINLCESCDMPCHRACPRKAFRSRSFDRSLCSIQMRYDRLEREAVAKERGALIDDVPVKFCRACELACPLGST